MSGATEKLFKEVSVKKLYKDCILLARFYGQRSGNKDQSFANMVRQQFKANMNELDDEKIKEQKEAAIRGLHNMALLEAEKYAKNPGKK
mmetsp:Transcript_25224/g.68545  ORF Transcript_25224/g.68545 Transcript_25224/m.68545 type:complete len:89 (+) Transcript_25224:16-282(+)